MVFPTMFARIEPGMVSQFSIYAVIFFSFFLVRWKRLFFLVLTIAVLTIFFSKSFAFAAMGGPGVCGTSCLANRNYYGAPYGGHGFYPYPTMPYHTFYGPSPYYFRPYGPSPYQPYNCIECMQRYQQFNSPMSFPGNSMPMTRWEVPLNAPIVVQTYE